MKILVVKNKRDLKRLKEANAILLLSEKTEIPKKLKLPIVILSRNRIKEYRNFKRLDGTAVQGVLKAIKSMYYDGIYHSLGKYVHKIKYKGMELGYAFSWAFDELFFYISKKDMYYNLALAVILLLVGTKTGIPEESLINDYDINSIMKFPKYGTYIDLFFCLPACAFTSVNALYDREAGESMRDPKQIIRSFASFLNTNLGSLTYGYTLAPFVQAGVIKKHFPIGG